MPPANSKKSSKNLPEKICVVCERPFTWRKKWERCWDEVTTCSKRCNSERRKTKKNTLAVSTAAKGQKMCDLCKKNVDLLIRCRTDQSKQWKMICGPCWSKVSGGVTDGDENHPYYQYGGLWKNRHSKKNLSTKPPSPSSKRNKEDTVFDTPTFYSVSPEFNEQGELSFLSPSSTCPSSPRSYLSIEQADSAHN
uniref:DUF2256 domain-containing protein n=1 Tax=Aureoumbra lagunensis TaxID=44058 RepID=A0A7S3NL29_9STRA